MDALLVCRACPDTSLKNSLMQFYGINNDADETVFFGSTNLDAPHFGSYWVKDGKVVGAFLESGKPEELAALKKVAEEQPAAPADLAKQGLDFAANFAAL